VGFCVVYKKHPPPRYDTGGLDIQAALI
jgi:hypothetical protein